MQVRQLHLGRGNEVEALGGMEEILLELRQLARARERGGVGKRRHPPLLVAAGGVLIQHEGDERALEAGAGTTEHVEAALSQLHATLEIDDVQGRAQIPVGLRLEALGGEIAGRAPAAHLGVVVLVLAHRRGGVHHVRNGEHERVHGGLGLGAGIAQGGKLLVDLAHRLLGGVGFVGLALAHERADLFRQLVALGLQGLFLGDDLAALHIKGGELLRREGGVAVLHRFGDLVEVLAYVLDVQHGAALFHNDRLPGTPTIRRFSMRPSIAPPAGAGGKSSGAAGAGGQKSG